MSHVEQVMKLCEHKIEISPRLHLTVWYCDVTPGKVFSWLLISPYTSGLAYYAVWLTQKSHATSSLKQLEIKPKLMAICSHAFSRAWHYFVVSSPDWFIVLFTYCDWFMTLNWKPRKPLGHVIATAFKTYASLCKLEAKVKAFVEVE